MSIETPTNPGDQVIEQTLEERIQSLEDRKQELEIWMKTGAKTREDAEELQRIEEKLKELRRKL